MNVPLHVLRYPRVWPSGWATSLSTTLSCPQLFRFSFVCGVCLGCQSFAFSHTAPWDSSPRINRSPLPNLLFPPVSPSSPAVPGLVRWFRTIWCGQQIRFPSLFGDSPVFISLVPDPKISSETVVLSFPTGSCSHKYRSLPPPNYSVPVPTPWRSQRIRHRTTYPHTVRVSPRLHPRRRPFLRRPSGPKGPKFGLVKWLYLLRSSNVLRQVSQGQRWDPLFLRQIFFYILLSVSLVSLSLS